MTQQGASILPPRLAQKPNEVAVRNQLDVFLAITPRRQKRRQPREIRDGLNVCRTLLAPERAVQIRSNAAVPRVASDLADVVDLIDHRLECDASRLRSRHSPHPVRLEHPRIE